MKTKYRNVPTIVDGIRFASKREAKRDAELQLLQRAGEINTLRRQPRMPLKVEGQLITTYVADWSYHERDGRWVFEDAKGAQTPEFKIKFALAKVLYPEIEWRLS